MIAYTSRVNTKTRRGVSAGKVPNKPAAASLSRICGRGAALGAEDRTTLRPTYRGFVRGQSGGRFVQDPVAQIPSAHGQEERGVCAGAPRTNETDCDLPRSGDDHRLD